MHTLYIDEGDSRKEELIQLLARQNFSINIIRQDLSLLLDSETHSCTRNGTPVVLTRKEFLLLSILTKHTGIPVAREEIIREVWNMSIDPFSNTVEAHIRSLRKKLGSPSIIHTVPKVGYRISLAP